MAYQEIKMFQCIRCLLPILLTTLLFAPLAHAYEEQIDAIAARVAERVGTVEKRTLAVVDFTDVQGTKTELGRFLAEELSVALLSADQAFRLVDRAHLARIMEESRLGESGIVDPTTAKELGRIAGVDLLITGTLTPLDDSVRLVVKVLETETANVLAGERETLPNSPAIRELLARGLSGAATNRPGGSGGNYTQSYDIQEQQAGGLTVTGRAVRKLQEGEAAVVLRIDNRNPTRVYLGPPLEDDQDGTLVDELGNRLSLFRGICSDIRTSSANPCGDYQDCLSLDSGESQHLTLVFGGRDRGLILGDRFTVGLRLRVCTGAEDQGKVVQFSFSDLKADPIPQPSSR
jgi:TolB-like protein